jgi:hypothetical protein
MEESKIRERITALIQKADDDVTPQEYGEIINGTSGILALLYGSGSKQMATFEREIAQEQKRVAGTTWAGKQRGAITQLAAGVLINTLAELDSGLVGSLKQQAAAEVLTDFIALSRMALAEKGEDAKNVAAVLAAAAFEDTVRRLGAAHTGTAGGEKLANILIELKNSAILQGPQVGIAQSYLKFRNDALHADWGQIEREGVHSVLSFVEQLVLRYFR